MERQEIISFLEGLVGQRFNMQSLNKKMMMMTWQTIT
jgi:hypothetical protein